MKLREILANLAHAKKTSFDEEKFLRELGIHDFDYTKNLDEHGFSCHILANWLCTDSWVGYNVICYNNDPIVVTYQSGRKNSVDYNWIGGEQTAKRIRDICYMIVGTEQLQIETADLDEEMGDGIKVAFSGQLVNDEVILDSTGELVKVVKVHSGYTNIENWQNLTVVGAAGVLLDVTTADVTIPWLNHG